MALMNDIWDVLGWLRAPFYALFFALCAIFGVGTMYFVCLPLSFLDERLAVECASVLCWFMWSIMQWLAENPQGLDVTFSGDDLPANEDALITCNHQGIVDYYLLHSVLMRRGMIGYCKYFYKKSINWIPLFGAGIRYMKFISVNRCWDKDKETILSYFSTHRDLELPMCLISYTEGTRFAQEKVKQSQEFCRAHGIEPFTYVLYPRTRGFIASVKGLRDSHVKYVYDFTCIYKNLEDKHPFNHCPSFARLHLSSLRGKYKFHVHTKKYLMADLPESDQELKEWLVQRYREKDELITDMYNEWKEGKTEPFKSPVPSRYPWRTLWKSHV